MIDILYKGIQMYRRHLKRILDFCLSLIAIIILFPIGFVLMIIGSIAMRGNPFFTQERPGYLEKSFKLLKFRSMSNKKDKEGKLLPNSVRLNKYGRILRSTSLDELPELINILKGDMSIVGPRPLLPEYLPYYTENEHHRHDVRPGLTGWAQVNGRNAISSWEERFEYDLYYVKNCSLKLDIYIIYKTVISVFRRTGIVSGGNKEIVGRLDDIRRNNNED